MTIEFEIINERISYEHVQKLIQKICEEHEHQHELHIKVTLHDVFVSESESSSEDKVS